MIGRNKTNTKTFVSKLKLFLLVASLFKFEFFLYIENTEGEKVLIFFEGLGSLVCCTVHKKGEIGLGTFTIFLLIGVRVCVCVCVCVCDCVCVCLLLCDSLNGVKKGKGRW